MTAGLEHGRSGPGPAWPGGLGGQRVSCSHHRALAPQATRRAARRPAPPPPPPPPLPPVSAACTAAARWAARRRGPTRCAATAPPSPGSRSPAWRRSFTARTTCRGRGAASWPPPSISPKPPSRYAAFRAPPSRGCPEHPGPRPAGLSGWRTRGAHSYEHHSCSFAFCIRHF